MAPTATYASPSPGASLLLAFKSAPQSQKTFLIIGSNALAAIRGFTALEAGFNVVVAAEGGLQGACPEIQWRVGHAHMSWRDLPPLDSSASAPGSSEIENAGRLLDSLSSLALVCVTDTLIPFAPASASANPPRSLETASLIASACRKRGIPVNVTDAPLLCDFTFPATHRFGTSTSLQMALTTNGKACRLATRIKREIVAALPKDVGLAVENIGTMRSGWGKPNVDGDEEEDVISVSPPVTTPVEQDFPGREEDVMEAQQRRMRWIAQLSEYWPLERLASMTEEEMQDALERGGGGHNAAEKLATMTTTGITKRRGCPKRSAIGERPSLEDASVESRTLSRHGLQLAPPERGRILLVGSGPGHPGLLTVAARKALTEVGTLILSDKLVPAQVLALIPKDKKLYIAKKYPGNSEGAQNELLQMALEGAERGETVVRLKQGDPFLYGRGGEEVLYFRQHGYEPLVIPGVSSALAGPLLAGIPVTQRGVAESLIICTGVGRQGREVELPGYERHRSLSILMGVARLPMLVGALTEEGTSGRRKGERYPMATPIAIIERASCPDQRVISSTLEHIEEGLRSVGEQRPPSMMFVGWAALALAGVKGDLRVLDDAAECDGNGDGAGESLSAKDAARVRDWLGDGGKWRVQEGLPTAGDWDKLCA